MADAITIKALQDASLDAKSLEEVVNGNDAKQVTTRLGENYPSVKKAIKTLFENGGLPATPFATKALMTASALVDGKYAMVTDDTVVANNGLYVKKAGVWVKSEYDPVENANEHTDTEIGRYLDTVSAAPFFSFTDSNLNELLTINGDGGLRIHGMHESVQDTFGELKASLAENSEHLQKINGEPFFSFTDSNLNELLTINGDGGLKLADMSTSVQEAIKDINKSMQVKKTHYNTKSLSHHPLTYTLPIAVKTKLNTLSLFGNISPVPLHILPSDLTIGTEWMQTVKLINNSATDVGDRRPVDGFDPEWREDIGVVHPSITEFTEQVAGYKYWMCLNPYTNNDDNIELPFIYGTNDPEFNDWVLIPEFPTPFDVDPPSTDGSYLDFLSDSGFTYDVETGDLILFWRKTLLYRANPDTGDTAHVLVGMYGRRFDGKAWSEIFDIIPLERSEGTDTGVKGTIYRSSSFIYNPIDKLYYIYVCHLQGIYYHTTPRIGDPVTQAVKCGMLGSDRWLWHTEIKSVGDKLIIMGAGYPIGDDKGGLFIGYSSNYTDFDIIANPIHAGNIEVYKPSFLPYIDENKQGHLTVVYTLPAGAEGISRYSLMITKTTNINFGV